MDFLTPLVAALIGGASVAVKGIADDAIMSTYTALKARLTETAPEVPICEIEQAIETGSPLPEIAVLIENLEAHRDDPVLRQLLDDLRARLDRVMAARPATIKEIIIPFPVVLHESQKVALVRQYPIGPALQPGLFSADRMARAMNRELSPIRSRALVSEANSLRAQADPEIPTEAICLDGLPDPALAGVLDFWYLASDQAAARGPRMVAALLLTSPINVWNEYGAEAFHRLPKEKST